MATKETITIEMPELCEHCKHRDAEAGGCCELMPGDPFETYEEQYENCPIWKLYDYNLGHENMSDLITLCWECHKKEHKEKY